jgi:hypothetical protein
MTREAWRTRSDDLEWPDLGVTVDPTDESASDEDVADSPRDEPMAVLDSGTTAAEEWRGDSIETWLSREEPDVLSRLPLPEDNLEEVYDTDDEERDHFPGRLVGFDEGTHDVVDGDDVAWVADGDTGGFSAEEAAMHVVPDAEL